MAPGSRRAWRAGPALVSAAAILMGAVACGGSGQRPTPITVVPVGPVQPPPPRPVPELVDDPGLASVVEARIERVDPMRWHNGEILYPYCLVHLTVDRQWKQPQPADLAVRIFGGMEGDRKYVSAIQPDPVTLTPSTHVLLFVSPVSELDPGVRAATVEEFFFVDGDRLLRFDRTPAGITLAEAIAALDRIPPSTVGSRRPGGG